MPVCGSLGVRILAFGVTGRLELEGGMLDIEVLGEALLQLFQQPRCPALRENLGVDAHMRGEDRRTSGELPYVHIVHAHNARKLKDVLADVSHRRPLRRRFG